MFFKWRREEDQLPQITSDQILGRILPQNGISFPIGFRVRAVTGSQQRLKSIINIKQPLFYLPFPLHLPLNSWFCLYFSETLRKIPFETSGCLTHWPASSVFHPRGKQWILFKCILSVIWEPLCRQSSSLQGRLPDPYSLLLTSQALLLCYKGHLTKCKTFSWSYDPGTHCLLFPQAPNEIPP